MDGDLKARSGEIGTLAEAIRIHDLQRPAGRFAIEYEGSVGGDGVRDAGMERAQPVEKIGEIDLRRRDDDLDRRGALLCRRARGLPRDAAVRVDVRVGRFDGRVGEFKERVGGVPEGLRDQIDRGIVGARRQIPAVQAAELGAAAKRPRAVWILCGAGIEREG